MSQFATSMSRLESQGILPTHTEHNPKHNVSAISLRSGKFYEGLSVSEPEKESKEVLGGNGVEKME